MAPAPDASRTPAARRYAGRTPQQRRADRRGRLRAAALELFGTTGVAATGINQLCAQAGVTARHFYEEYGSKEALLLDLYLHIMQDVEHRVRQALDNAPLDHVLHTRAGIGAYVHGLLDDPRRARIVCEEIVGVEEVRDAAEATARAYVELTWEHARRLAAAGMPVNIEPSHYIVVALVGGAHEAIRRWLADPQPPAVDVLVDELTQLYVAAGRIPPRAEWSRPTRSVRRRPTT